MENGRIAVLQLSDIHLKANERGILTRIDALCSAIRAQVAGCACLFLVLTGDIAYSGAADEYGLAGELIETLLSRLRGVAGRTEIVLLPGNHDCDFRAEPRLRPIVLQGIETMLDEIDSEEHDGANTALAVQSNFFVFAARHQKATGDKLHYRLAFSLDGGRRIRFECLNTAWVSRKEEQQGQIRIAPAVARRLHSAEAQPDDLAVTLLHHPYAWFEPTNRRQTQDAIEGSSDLVLTGHEHDPDEYRRTEPGAGVVHYIEGGALQAPGGSSSFNLVTLDLEAEHQELWRFEWQGGGYRSADRAEPAPLIRNRGVYARRFASNEAFAERLADPGREFKHPRRRDLRLRDLFVYPDLRERMLDKRLKGDKSAPATIYGENVAEHVGRAKRALIVGPEESGKTALLRALYGDFQRALQVVPVMLRGSDVRGHTASALDRAVERAISAQYSPAVVAEYMGMPPERKALLIDDFDSFEYNSKAQAGLLREARDRFGRIVVAADDLYRYEQLSQEAREHGPFIDFEQCEIKPLGFRLRRDLIRKWVLLGQEYSINQREVFEAVEHRERVIDNILRGDFIPAFALTVLLILQACEVDPNHAVNSGTYGYLNDFLITRALATVSKQVTDIGTMSAYLSYLAHSQFVADREYLSREEFEEATARYIEQYGLMLTPERLLANLTSAKLLVAADGQVGFRCRHYFYYFVAKFFSDNIEGRRDKSFSSELNSQLRDIADHLYFDPYVSILTFYFYFRKDEGLIEYLLGNSRQIYCEYEPCDLGTHVSFLNELYEKKPDRLLPEPDPEKRQAEIRRGMDREDDGDRDMSTPRPAKLKYSRELQDHLKMNIALKTMQVLGQVLKDSPGQLPASLKTDIAAECYSIGLRALRALFAMAELNLADFQRAIEELIKERRAYDPEARVPKDANRFLLWLCLGAALGVIRRTSRAVGHTQLGRTYLAVLERFRSLTSAELIDFSIRLDHFHQVSRPVVEDMVRDRLRDNIFGYQILQDLVYNHYALFPSDRSERQQICDLVGIYSQDPRFLDKRQKMLPAPANKTGKRRRKRR